MNNPFKPCIYAVFSAKIYLKDPPSRISVYVYQLYVSVAVQCICICICIGGGIYVPTVVCISSCIYQQLFVSVVACISGCMYQWEAREATLKRGALDCLLERE